MSATLEESRRTNHDTQWPDTHYPPSFASGGINEQLVMFDLRLTVGFFPPQSSWIWLDVLWRRRSSNNGSNFVRHTAFRVAIPLCPVHRSLRPGHRRGSAEPRTAQLRATALGARLTLLLRRYVV